MKFMDEISGDASDMSDMSDATFPDKWLFAAESKICDSPVNYWNEMGNMEKSRILVSLASLVSRSGRSLTRAEPLRLVFVRIVGATSYS